MGDGEEVKSVANRPTMVTAAGVIGIMYWLWLGLSIFLILVFRSPRSHGYLPYLPSFFLLMFGLIGFWRMRRWGVVICIISAVVTVFQFEGKLDIVSWTVFGLLTCIGLLYFREMK